eukprot:scaffold78828_cov23-Tisochrysis_lutea.AAC.1
MPNNRKSSPRVNHRFCAYGLAEVVQSTALGFRRCDASAPGRWHPTASSDAPLNQMLGAP